jgi:hypothetical protein
VSERGTEGGREGEGRRGEGRGERGCDWMNVKEMGEDQGSGRKLMWLGRGKGEEKTSELRHRGCGGGDEGTET